MNALLENAIRVSIVLAIALGTAVVLRQRSPALRHWILGLAVVCAVAVPVLSALLPSWLDTPLWSLSPGRDAVVGVRESEDAAQGSLQRSSAVQSEWSIRPLPRQQTGAGVIWSAAWGVWIFGCLAGLFSLIVGLTRLKWLASRARHVQDSHWLDAAEALRRSYRLRSSVELLQSDHRSLLMAWGWARPRILLPAAAREWSGDRVHVVLAHEFAHIARGDWVFQLIAEILRVVYWFNPLVWIVCRRLRTESEWAADAAVLAGGIEGAEYATHLLGIARELRSGRAGGLPATAMARPSSLEGRVRAMLNTTRSRRPVSSFGRVVSLAALLALTVAVAGLRAQPRFYSVAGTVVDQSDRVLPGTTLALTNPITHAKYEVQADSTGRFEFIGVPRARYILAVALPGFETLSDEVEITGNTVRDVRLRVGSLQETVTVTDRTGSGPQQDPATEQKREAARTRFAEILQREMARCAEVGAATPVGGNILPPLKLLDVRPVFPEHLRVAKVSGVVTMDAVIGTDGTVWEVRNVNGPHPDLEAAAAAAVRQWLFSVTLLNCEPIEVRMKVTVRFNVQP